MTGDNGTHIGVEMDVTALRFCAGEQDILHISVKRRDTADRSDKHDQPQDDGHQAGQILDMPMKRQRVGLMENNLHTMARTLS